MEIWKCYEDTFYVEFEHNTENQNLEYVLRKETILSMFFLPELEVFLEKLKLFCNDNYKKAEINDGIDKKYMCQHIYTCYTIISHQLYIIVNEIIENEDLFIHHVKTCLIFKDESNGFHKSFDAKLEVRKAIYNALRYFYVPRLLHMYGLTFLTKSQKWFYYNVANKLAFLLLSISQEELILRIDNYEENKKSSKFVFQATKISLLLRHFVYQVHFLDNLFKNLDVLIDSSKPLNFQCTGVRKSISDNLKYKSYIYNTWEIKIRGIESEYQITCQSLLSFMMYCNLVRMNDSIYE